MISLSFDLYEKSKVMKFCVLYFQTHGCTTCHLVAKAESFYPPTLRRRRPVTIDLRGEWFSERCETRPNSMFVTRRLLFSNNNQTWQGYYYHYADALCREPMFTIFAKGTYVAGAPSQEVTYAYHYDFKVLQAKVTAEDQRMSRTLNEQQGSSDCGQQEEWEVGREQDVTSTRGCAPLGITVPHVEYELLKVEKDHKKSKLYLGQRATDGQGPETPQKRPTSFQPPLVKCSRSLENDFRPPVKAKVHVYHRGSSSHLATSIYLTLTMVLYSYLLL